MPRLQGLGDLVNKRLTSRPRAAVRICNCQLSAGGHRPVPRLPPECTFPRPGWPYAAIFELRGRGAIPVPRRKSGLLARFLGCPLNLRKKPEEQSIRAPMQTQTGQMRLPATRLSSGANAPVLLQVVPEVIL